MEISSSSELKLRESWWRRNSSTIFKVLEVAFDVGVPLGLYYVLKIYLSNSLALIISGVPPLLRSIFKRIWYGRTDYVLIILLISFVSSAVLGLVTDNARLTLLDNAVTTGCIGFLFITTLLPRIDPLVYTLFRGQIPLDRIKRVAATLPASALRSQVESSEAERFETERTSSTGYHFPSPDPDYFALYYKESISMRRDCVILTAFIGLSLLAHCAGIVILIVGTSLDIDTIMLVPVTPVPALSASDSFLQQQWEARHKALKEVAAAKQLQEHANRPWREQELQVRLQCKYCMDEVPQLIEDWKEGHIRCACGLILMTRLLHCGEEWRNFAEEPGNDRSRVGAPSNPLKGPSHMDATSIGSSSVARGAEQKLIKAQTTLQGNSKGSHAEAFRDIDTIIGRMFMPQAVADCAKMVYEVATSNGIKGKNMASKVGACIYMACSMHHVKRPLEAIAPLVREDTKSIARIVRAIRVNCKLGDETSAYTSLETGSELSNHIRSIVDQLGLKYRIAKAASDLAVQVKRQELLTGRHLKTVVAACVYAACSWSSSPSERRSAHEIAKLCGCVESTVNVAYRILCDNRDSLRPDFANARCPIDNQTPGRMSGNSPETKTPDPWWKRNSSLIFKLLEIAFDVGVPLALYYILKNYISNSIALIISGVPPLLRSIFKQVWYRQTDYILIILFISFVASAIIGLVTDNARLVLLDNAVTTGCIAALFIVTLGPWMDPLAYTLFRGEIPIDRLKRVAATLPASALRSPDESAETQPISSDPISPATYHFPSPDPDYFALFYKESAALRRDCRLLTGFIGLSLLAQCIGLIVIIVGTSLDIDALVIITRIYNWVFVSIIVATSMLYTFSYMRRTSFKGLLIFIAGYRIKSDVEDVISEES
ncbi:transcription initiation factor IIB [Gonapodya sp. JEL0774]|nr:transcription initiation factor IIB [Gonapodya sp. JEL0774]